MLIRNSNTTTKMVFCNMQKTTFVNKCILSSVNIFEISNNILKHGDIQQYFNTCC